MKNLSVVTALLAALLLAGCGYINLPAHLSRALLDQPDPETVREGAPAYLTLIDTLIEASPKDADRLIAGAQLYALYASDFVTDPTRQKILARRAKGYGMRALCADEDELCGLPQRPYQAFLDGLKTIDDDDQVPALYAMTVGWLAWIRANGGDWGAIADLPKAEAALRKIIALDEGYRDGSAHDLLGILLTLRPAALGGKPEEARRHFERAIALSCGRDLSVKVDFARSYARLVYDRPLHDRLLKEVLAANPVAPGLTMTNVLAQRQAKALLASADDYF